MPSFNPSPSEPIVNNVTWLPSSLPVDYFYNRESIRLTYSDLYWNQLVNHVPNTDSELDAMFRLRHINFESPNLTPIIWPSGE